jgi:hypothetical protein
MQALDELTVTIPLPSHVPRARGHFADASTLDANLKVRVSDAEHAMIASVSEELSMKPSEFIRHCAAEVALQLLRRKHVRVRRDATASG